MPPLDNATTPSQLNRITDSIGEDFLLSFETVRRWLTAPLIRIGETEITITGLFVACLIVMLALVVSAILQRAISPWLNRRLQRSPGVAYAILRFIHYAVILVGVLVAADFIGLNMSTFAIVLGFLSVGIGFGLQNITSNFISGLILLLERPIGVGDLVRVNEEIGRVTTINMRATHILTFDNITIIVPNSKFVEGNVVNWSHGDTRIRIHAPVGVAYGSDIGTVRECLLKVAHEHSRVLDSPAPEVRFLEFGDSSLNFDLLVWIDRPGQQFLIQSDLNYAIDKAFREANVTIPFPQRDLHLQMTPAIERLAKTPAEQGDRDV